MEHDDRVTLTAANAHFVTDRLAVGGDLDLYDAELVVSQVLELRAAGITHVLDVRQEWDDAMIWADVPGVVYRWDGIDDAGQRIPGSWFDGITAWALEALRDPDAKLLTHCHMGVNRGPSAGYAVLLALGWDPIAALDAIRRARPIAYVAYAEDALSWHHERTGADAPTRERDLGAVRSWREQNSLDLLGVIRRIRRHEAS